MSFVVSVIHTLGHLPDVLDTETLHPSYGLLVGQVAISLLHHTDVRMVRSLRSLILVLE